MEEDAQCDLNAYIGEMGVYQLRVCIVLFLFTMCQSDFIHIVFIGGDMPHWCRVPQLDDLPYEVQTKVGIPASQSSDHGDEYSSCEMFALNYSVYNRTEFYSWNRSLMITDETSVVKCSEWTYDQSLFISTVISKFDLVCDRAHLVQVISTVLMAGWFIGALTAGIVSDRFGRKVALLSYSVMKIVGIVFSLFGPNYETFVIGRFFIGCGLGPIFVAIPVLVSELVGSRYRAACVAVTLAGGISTGIMLQPAIAYLLRDEFWYQVAALSPNIVCPILVLLFVPESLRWLAVRRKYDVVTKLMHKICKTNGRELEADFKPSCLQNETEVKQQNCSALLTSATIRKRMLICCFVWLTTYLIYFGIAINVGSLHGNIYLNTFIAGAVDVPAFIIAITVMNRKAFGRRRTARFAFFVAAMSNIVCIPVITYDVHAATVAFSMLSKFTLAVFINVANVYFNELLPTEVRSAGFGAIDTCGRVSTLVVPFFGQPLMSVWKPLPYLVFGVFAFTASLLLGFLPPTLGQVLLDTVAEMERNVI